MNKEVVLAPDPGRTCMALVGGALGLIVAVLFLTLGFWRTVLIVVLVALGAGIGALADRRTPSLGRCRPLLSQGPGRRHPF